MKPWWRCASNPEYDTIPTDTTANVLTAGLLGEQYIGLSAGGSDEFLKNGDEIELTQSAMVLEEVISRFLFSKAESGSEKKAPPSEASASEEDVKADTSAVEEIPVKTKAPVTNVEEPPVTHGHKPKQGTDEEVGSAHKSKMAHRKAAEESHASHKPKAAHGQEGEEAEPSRKAAKPVPK